MSKKVKVDINNDDTSLNNSVRMGKCGLHGKMLTSGSSSREKNSKQSDVR